MCSKWYSMVIFIYPLGSTNIAFAGISPIFYWGNTSSIRGSIFRPAMLDYWSVRWKPLNFKPNGRVSCSSHWGSIWVTLKFHAIIFGAICRYSLWKLLLFFPEKLLEKRKILEELGFISKMKLASRYHSKDFEGMSVTVKANFSKDKFDWQLTDLKS